MSLQGNISEDVLAGLAVLGKSSKAQAGYKHDPPSISPTTNIMHGPGGIFGQAGLDQTVFGSRIKPMGLVNVLPARGTTDENPIVPFVTGFTDTEDATEPTGPCDDPLEAGLIKSCYMGAAFGRVKRKTKQLALLDVGRRTNRGEFLDLRLVNEPLLEQTSFTPSGPTAFEQAFQSEVASRLLTLGVSFESVLAKMVWTGNPTNNTSGGYAEFPGLETLVGTGKTDVMTQTACPTLDSDVKDFNYATVEDSATALFRTLTTIYRFVRYNAKRMSFGEVQWIFVMRQNLFDEIADVWPCTFATYRCVTADTSNPNNTDAMEMRRMTNEMRDGQFLMIDNVRVPVVIDDGIPEATSTTDANVNEASYASDIYLLPLTVRGGLSTLYFEFFDYTEAGREISRARLGEANYVSDGGRFLWGNEQSNGCFAMNAVVEPRLRLLTPQLAGRLQNVQYSPLQHYRDPFNDDPYFVNGGEIARSNAPYAATDVT